MTGSNLLLTIGIGLLMLAGCWGIGGSVGQRSHKESEKQDRKVKPRVAIIDATEIKKSVKEIEANIVKELGNANELVNKINPSAKQLDPKSKDMSELKASDLTSTTIEDIQKIIQQFDPVKATQPGAGGSRGTENDVTALLKHNIRPRSGESFFVGGPEEDKKIHFVWVPDKDKDKGFWFSKNEWEDVNKGKQTPLEGPSLTVIVKVEIDGNQTPKQLLLEGLSCRMPKENEWKSAKAIGKQTILQMDDGYGEWVWLDSAKSEDAVKDKTKWLVIGKPTEPPGLDPDFKGDEGMKAMARIEESKAKYSPPPPVLDWDDTWGYSKLNRTPEFVAAILKNLPPDSELPTDSKQWGPHFRDVEKDGVKQLCPVRFAWKKVQEEELANKLTTYNKEKTAFDNRPNATLEKEDAFRYRWVIDPPPKSDPP